jgi:hypothetical protein
VGTAAAPQAVLKLHDLGVVVAGGEARRRAYVALGNDLESPAGHGVGVAVPSVRVLEVEDGFERVGRFFGKAVGADVESSVGPGGDDFSALLTKGSSTCGLYSGSTASLTTTAIRQSDRM